MGYIPEESPKDNGGHTAAPEGAMTDPPAVSPQRSDGNKGREPEDHGHELDTSNGILVSGSRKSGRGKDEICNSKKSPDGGEEHKGDAPWDP